jgi:hypothetical protein
MFVTAKDVHMLFKDDVSATEISKCNAKLETCFLHVLF